MRPASARSCWSAWASVSDPVDIVRAGYDALSYQYRADDSDEGRYAAWIDTVRTHCAPGGAVLDAGCGCGVPVSRSLARAGCEVVGAVGPRVVAADFVPEGDGGHAFFSAVRGESPACLPA